MNELRIWEISYLGSPFVPDYVAAESVTDAISQIEADRPAATGVVRLRYDEIAALLNRGQASENSTPEPLDTGS